MEKPSIFCKGDIPAQRLLSFNQPRKEKVFLFIIDFCLMVPITIHNSDYRSINRRNFLEKHFLHIGILHGTYVKA